MQVQVNKNEMPLAPVYYLDGNGNLTTSTDATKANADVLIKNTGVVYTPAGVMVQDTPPDTIPGAIIQPTQATGTDTTTPAATTQTGNFLTNNPMLTAGILLAIFLIYKTYKK